MCRPGRAGIMVAVPVERPADETMTRAVFFDVDFTLIYPGPSLQGEGYGFFCARHGVAVDTARFRTAVGMAAPVLDEVKAHNYDAQLFIDYTRAIIEHMGGRGPGADLAARDIYDEWAACRHFFLYDDVEPVLRRLAEAGLKIGLISNTQRPLDEFAAHFALDKLFSARDFVGRARVPEAAPRDLRGGAGRGRRAGRPRR
ncbi:MAG: hypothetical protein M0C28_13420 [Candidatus Moduliflexus flocculans]|nr:hypothetical protein [Candidatus Moduliflexus flocculans]